MTFRFVQESIANTLGWPLHPVPRADDWRRMLLGGTGAAAEGGGRFARLALEWLAALSRSLDLVVISEHFDESLLLLARRLGIASTELIYLSQKRRAQSASATRGAGSTFASAPAARAAQSPAAVGNISAVPPPELLRDPDGPWLWPSELDTAMRANWLDSMAYMHFNRSLWRQIRDEWPGAAGAAAMKAELATFRAARAALKTGCEACERLGAAGCLAMARRTTGQPPPHLCWSVRQDTRSWSEHFFHRMALRFDAAAAMRDGAPRNGKGGDGDEHIDGLPSVMVGRGARRRSAATSDAGVRTGNVNWWRCPANRAVPPRCAKPNHAAGAALRYSLWDCRVCHP